MIKLFSALAVFALASCATEPEPDWPKTCDAAVQWLLDELPEAERDNLASTKSEDLILLHFGLGRGIRNNFGLWGGNLALIEDCSGDPAKHPDDVSMIIIERLWLALQ